MTIQYLVLSGGAAAGLAIYGALKYLSQNNYWNINNITSIYATSVGSLLSVIISLNYDWESLDDYIIKRPWDKIVSFTPEDLFNIWLKKGMFDANTIKEVLSSLLTAKDLSESTTLKEFYEYNNIEIHMYTVNINESTPTKIDISYKTHPNLELYKAVTMSCAIPIIFTPVYDNSGCYVDGGIINNFPLNDCINNCIHDDENKYDEILAFKACIIKKKFDIIEETNMLSYLYCLINGIRNLATTENNQYKIKNIVDCYLDNNDFNNWKDSIIDRKIREEMISTGVKCGENFLNK